MKADSHSFCSNTPAGNKYYRRAVCSLLEDATLRRANISSAESLLAMLDARLPPFTWKKDNHGGWVVSTYSYTVKFSDPLRDVKERRKAYIARLLCRLMIYTTVKQKLEQEWSSFSNRNGVPPPTVASSTYRPVPSQHSVPPIPPSSKSSYSIIRSRPSSPSLGLPTSAQQGSSGRSWIRRLLFGGGPNRER